MKDESKKVKQVIEMEEEAYLGISAAVKKDIEDLKKALIKNPTLLTEKNLFKKWEPDPNSDLINATYVLFMKSYLLGMAHTPTHSFEFADIELEDLDEALPFEEAIEWLKGRASLSKDEFYALSDQMRKKAFTVGRLTQLDMIEKVRNAYIADLSGSKSSMIDFIKSVSTDVDALGMPGYYETVYRTNIQTDYNAGRAMQLEQNPPLYMEFIGIEDSRQTDICSDRSGIILPYDDPWWEKNWPPLHFNCRSTVRAIYKEEAEALGITPSAHPRGSAKNAVQSGFGAKPTGSGFAPTPGQADRIEAYGIKKEIAGLD